MIYLLHSVQRSVICIHIAFWIMLAFTNNEHRLHNQASSLPLASVPKVCHPRTCIPSWSGAQPSLASQGSSHLCVSASCTWCQEQRRPEWCSLRTPPFPAVKEFVLTKKSDDCIVTRKDEALRWKEWQRVFSYGMPTAATPWMMISENSSFSENSSQVGQLIALWQEMMKHRKEKSNKKLLESGNVLNDVFWNLLLSYSNRSVVC